METVAREKECRRRLLGGQHGGRHQTAPPSQKSPWPRASRDGVMPAAGLQMRTKDGCFFPLGGRRATAAAAVLPIVFVWVCARYARVIRSAREKGDMGSCATTHPQPPSASAKRTHAVMICKGSECARNGSGNGHHSGGSPLLLKRQLPAPTGVQGRGRWSRGVVVYLARFT